MSAAFGRSAPCTIRIEEEYQLLSAESHELVPRFDAIAAEADDERVRQELMTSVLEAATGVHERVSEAVAEVREIRGHLQQNRRAEPVPRRDVRREPARAAAAHLRRPEPAAQRLGCSDELGEVERIIDRGNGADEQRRVHDADGGLLAVSRWVAEQTVAGL